MTLKLECPKCHGEISGFQGQPSPGDVGICTHCAATLAFEDDLTLRLARESDLDNVDPQAAWAMGLLAAGITRKNSN